MTKVSSKGKHKIWENHSFRRNLLRKQGFLWFSGKCWGNKNKKHKKTSFYRCQCFAPVVSTVASPKGQKPLAFGETHNPSTNPRLNGNPQWGKGHRVLIWTSLDFYRANIRLFFNFPKFICNVTPVFNIIYTLQYAKRLCALVSSTMKGHTLL